MIDRMQNMEKLKSIRQYLGEHYGVHSMMLFDSLARNEQRDDSDVDRAGVRIYLQELFECVVDVVRMRENTNPLFEQQMLKFLSPFDMEKLDAACMVLIAMIESVKILAN